MDRFSKQMAVYNRLNKVYRPFKIMEEHIKNIHNLSASLSAIKITGIQKTIENFRSTQEYIRSMERFNQGIIETEQDLMVFGDVMVELGYPPHEDLTLDQIRTIVKYHREGMTDLKKLVDKFMFRYYSAERLREIQMRWENSDTLKPRLHILRNAVMAHNLGMYSLVPPAIMSQLEGLLMNAFNHKGRSNGRIQKIYLKHLLRDGMEIDGAFHRYYSEQVLSGFSFGDEINVDISRHAILHGGATNFGTAQVSLKVILLFDYLHDALDRLGDETIAAAKSEVSQV